jgi:hypothetical protein
MFLDLELEEIDALVKHVASTLEAGDPVTLPLANALTKLQTARALASVIGQSYIDPDSPAAALLLTAAGIMDTQSVRVTASVTASMAEDEEEGEEEDDADEWPAGQSPPLNTVYGWQRNGSKLAPNKAEQEIIKCALRGKKKGWGYTQIADDLNGRRLRTRRGSRWTSSTVRHLVTKSCQHEQNAKLLARYGSAE